MSEVINVIDKFLKRKLKKNSENEQFMCAFRFSAIHITHLELYAKYFQGLIGNFQITAD